MIYFWLEGSKVYHKGLDCIEILDFRVSVGTLRQARGKLISYLNGIWERRPCKVCGKGGKKA